MAAGWLSKSWRRALIVTVGVLAFATSLGTPVFLDDGEAIERHPYIRSLSALSAALTSPPHDAQAGLRVLQRARRFQSTPVRSDVRAEGWRQPAAVLIPAPRP